MNVVNDMYDEVKDDNYTVVRVLIVLSKLAYT